MDGATSARLDPRAWAIWSQRPRITAYSLLVEGAVLIVLVRTSHEHVTATDWRMFAILVLLGVTQAELSRRVERARRMVTFAPHINMSSVWTFAGVLLLPAVLLPILVAVLYTHLAVRSWRQVRHAPPHKSILNASLVSVTCLVSKGALVLVGWPGLMQSGVSGNAPFGQPLFAALVYFLVAALISLPGVTPNGWSATEIFGTVADNGLEILTIGLGAVNAVLLVTIPELAVVMVPTVLLVQRSVSVRALELAATTDAKTGTLNVGSWRTVAERELARARRAGNPLGILMIDLDHFKRVNDSYGHLIGDQVLKRVAEAISTEVRDYDRVGRFGGEEFVVVLPETTAEDTFTVCERIRQAVRSLGITVTRQAAPELIQGLTVSVGFAMMPGSGTTVDELLNGADAALYRAKRKGRDCVVHVADPIVDPEAGPDAKTVTLDTVDEELLSQPVPETAT